MKDQIFLRIGLALVFPFFVRIGETQKKHLLSEAHQMQ